MDAFEAAESNKLAILNETLAHLRIFTLLNTVFDVVFSVGGLVFFGLNYFFLTLAIAALLSSMYVVWYAGDAAQFAAKPRKLTTQWYWENNSVLWRYTACKFLLIFGFIITAVVETARIDVAHIMANLDVAVYVELGVLVFLAALLTVLALYIIPRHHQVVGNTILLYDNVSVSQTSVRL